MSSDPLVLLGHPVLWTPTASLVQELLAAKRDLRLPQLLAKLDRYHDQRRRQRVLRPLLNARGRECGLKGLRARC